MTLERLEHSTQLKLLREARKSVEELFALEDTGWTQLGSSGDMGITEAERMAAVRMARIYAFRDPLCRQSIRLWTDYTFGSGITWQAKDDAAQEALSLYWGAPLNSGLLSAKGQRKSSDKCLIDGEIFFALFLDDPPKLRRIDPLEITEIIANPEDSEDVRYYRRDYTTPQGKMETVYYRDWRNEAGESCLDSVGATIQTKEGPLVYHLALNTIGTRGNTLLLPALDWVKQYRRFLASRIAIMLALARFAWKTKIQGGAAAVATEKATLEGQTPSAGSVRIENMGADMEPIRTDSNARNAYDDARMLKLQICAAVGIPEQYFGDLECYSADTEVLTDRGWMLHKDWVSGVRVAAYNPETKGIEYLSPLGLRAFDHAGDMVHFHNAQTDILVTPNHRMWTAPKVGWKLGGPRRNPSKGGRRSVAEGGVAVVDRSWRFEEARHLLAYPRAHGWMFQNTVTASDSVGLAPDWTVQRARFLGYWLAEGYTLGDRTKDGRNRTGRQYYRIGISQLPGATLERMKGVMPGRCHEQVNQGGVVTLTMMNKALWSYLRQECGTNSHDKRIPRALFTANRAVRQALLSALLEGDGGPANGHGTGGWRYSSVSKQLADDVMELAFGLGYATSIVHEACDYRGEPHPIWRVSIREKLRGTHIEPDQATVQTYAGKVYCFALPQYHIYVTRRNGKIAIQGNTGNLATAKTVELPMQKMFESYQRVWADAYNDLDSIVLAHADVPEDKRYADRDFPGIAPEDQQQLAANIALLLPQFPAFADSRDVQQMALMAMGVKDTNDVLDDLSNPEATPESQREATAVLVRALRRYSIEQKQLQEARNGNGHRGDL